MVSPRNYYLGAPSRKVEKELTSPTVVHILKEFFCTRKTTKASEALVTHNFYQLIMKEPKENVVFNGQMGKNVAQTSREREKGRHLEGRPNSAPNHLEILPQSEIHACVLRRSMSGRS